MAVLDRYSGDLLLMTDRSTTTTTTTTGSDHPSAGRMLGVFVAGVVGWVIGFYLGVFAVLSLFGLYEAVGFQFLVSTTLGGAIGASLGASLAHPNTRASFPAVLAAGLLAAVLAIVALQIIDGDFGVAILGGGAVVVGAVVIAAGANDSG